MTPNYSYSKPERWKKRIYAPNEAAGYILGDIPILRRKKVNPTTANQNADMTLIKKMDDFLGINRKVAILGVSPPGVI